MNISYERINRPRRVGETTRPIPCDLPDTTHELEIPFYQRSEVTQTVLDILAVIAWSCFGLVLGLGVFLAWFFLFGGEF